MSLLLITLPPGLPGNYDYATSTDGQSLASHGTAAIGLLPPAGRGVEVVAMAPASQVSWHRVTLPRGVGPGSPRLRPTLVGMLEDVLLDDPDQLHFAVDPDAAGGGNAWVAVCNRAWLAAHLRALDAAQRPITRIVPELRPRTGALRMIVTGEPDHARVLMTGDGVPGGAQALPFTQGTLALLPPDALKANSDGDGAPLELLAEPAVAELAEQLLNRRVTIHQPAKRLLAASRSNWDLAQLDLARTGRARAVKRAGAMWRDFLHAPQWRPARWGVAVLLLANLAGLNLWAWRTQDELQTRRAQVNGTLTESFPHVRAIVDAPVQMSREVASLRQRSGATSHRDLEPMISALGQVLGTQTTPSAIEYSAGELRVKGVPLPASALSDANQRLRPLGYRAHTDADALVLRQESSL
ncbi:general secretion pathway protein GspL [Ottowia sp. GY511]|uniref:Type II secretion system protein GspL n=1 Tax=Ottowia flava TaxID=2675430 RepID=A0ABW4KZ25_9BURK|nr:type II secretion system protein GspL [Ottowia sp. GY511]TXK29791.1 general secretion pathway protein GspL [Ottowia sp. GY511]